MGALIRGSHPMRPIPHECWRPLHNLLVCSPLRDPWAAQLRLMIAADTLFAQASGPVWVVGEWGPKEAVPALMLEVHRDTGVIGLLADGQEVDMEQWKLAHPTARSEVPAVGLVQMRPTWRDGGDCARRHVTQVLISEGVGLCFELAPGLPLDPDDFAHVLMRESCHPEFGRAIARDLLSQGTRCTTVMAIFHARWPALAARLARFGVHLRLCWPRIAPVRIPTQKVVWPEQEVMDQAQSRLEAAYVKAVNQSLVTGVSASG